MADVIATYENGGEPVPLAQPEAAAPKDGKKKGKGARGSARGAGRYDAAAH